MTCHRVELYGSRAAGAPPAADVRWPGAEVLNGQDAASHLVRLAVGRQSAVVAEDQILHQLRLAVHEARAAGGLTVDLDRLFDVALRAGRRARSWLPARRVTLPEIALRRMLGRTSVPAAPVLVVGTGQMGRLAAMNLVARGAHVMIASRTPERARAMADQLVCETADFDPGPATLAGVAGIVVALAGHWALPEAAYATLLDSKSWVIDLSAPPALHEGLRRKLGPRLVTIDDLADLADAPGEGPSQHLLERLDALADATLSEYAQWSAAEAQRAAAQALSHRAASAESAELAQLWQRAPTLDDVQREEIEKTVRQLTRRLLRDPLEQLSEDGDGRHARAARELFRL